MFVTEYTWQEKIASLEIALSAVRDDLATARAQTKKLETVERVLSEQIQQLEINH